MILTLQVAKERKLAARPTATPPPARTAVLYSQHAWPPWSNSHAISSVSAQNFGLQTFEVDLLSLASYTAGHHDQASRSDLSILGRACDHPGELVTRGTSFHQNFWALERTFFLFRVWPRSAIKSLRDALGDSGGATTATSRLFFARGAANLHKSIARAVENGNGVPSLAASPASFR